MTYMNRRPLALPGRPGMGADAVYDPYTGELVSPATATPVDTSIWADLETWLTAPSAADADPADNINQTEGGGTSTTVSDFTSVGGVCKPKNLPALAAARAFQSQLNRVAQVKGWSKIATDGSIGPATLTLFRKIQSAAGAGTIGGDASSCLYIAADSDVLAAQVQAYADSIKAPATVSAAMSLSPPSILTKSGKTVIVPDGGIAASLATLSGIEKIALVGVVGGIGYLLLHRRKKRR